MAISLVNIAMIDQEPGGMFATGSTGENVVMVQSVNLNIVAMFVTSMDMGHGTVERFWGMEVVTITVIRLKTGIKSLGKLL